MSLHVTAKFSAFLSKIREDRNTQFHTQCQTNALIIFSGFQENRKTGRVIGQTGNENESEHLKNGSNDFLQIL